MASRDEDAGERCGWKVWMNRPRRKVYVRESQAFEPRGAQAELHGDGRQQDRRASSFGGGFGCPLVCPGFWTPDFGVRREIETMGTRGRDVATTDSGSKL